MAGEALWREFFRPVAAVSLVLAVGGIAFAVYSFYVTSSRPVISWIESRQIVFDYKSATPEIVVSDARGARIQQNMYASQFNLWNSGNTRFDNVDASTVIREPLGFHLKGEGKIVSASITDKVNDTAGNWSIDTNGRDARMLWQHFDPGAAVRILLIYTGNDQTDVHPAIAVAGYTVLNFVPEPQTKATWAGFVIGISLMVAIGGLGGVGVLVIFVKLATRFWMILTKRPPPFSVESIPNVLGCGAMLIGAACAAMIVYGWNVPVSVPRF